MPFDEFDNQNGGNREQARGSLLVSVRPDSALSSVLVTEGICAQWDLLPELYQKLLLVLIHDIVGDEYGAFVDNRRHRRHLRLNSDTDLIEAQIGRLIVCFAGNRQEQTLEICHIAIADPNDTPDGEPNDFGPAYYDIWEIMRGGVSGGDLTPPTLQTGRLPGLQTLITIMTLKTFGKVTMLAPAPARPQSPRAVSVEYFFTSTGIARLDHNGIEIVERFKASPRSLTGKWLN